mmetsp:Transcript_1436/g.2972  ORF Transcript_1436/g.2972 Transcript_1436/m.2972 type:complete len:304 (-) Transcript_1436:93-1004(-)
MDPHVFADNASVEVGLLSFGCLGSQKNNTLSAIKQPGHFIVQLCASDRLVALDRHNCVGRPDLHRVDLPAEERGVFEHAGAPELQLIGGESQACCELFVHRHPLIDGVVEGKFPPDRLDLSSLSLPFKGAAGDDSNPLPQTERHLSTLSRGRELSSGLLRIRHRENGCHHGMSCKGKFLQRGEHPDGRCGEGGKGRGRVCPHRDTPGVRREDEDGLGPELSRQSDHLLIREAVAIDHCNLGTLQAFTCSGGENVNDLEFFGHWFHRCGDGCSGRLLLCRSWRHCLKRVEHHGWMTIGSKFEGL